MKKSFFFSLLFIMVFAITESKAQINISVNIGAQPVWGPIGYEHVDYYYLPDAEAYYDINGGVFVYYEGGAWVRRASLPARYANFDFYHSYKVVLNAPQPWLRHDTYRVQYGSYRGRHDQVVIRDSRDSKYYVVKGHPMYGQGQEHHEEHDKDHKENHGEGHKDGGHGEGKGHGH